MYQTKQYVPQLSYDKVLDRWMLWLNRGVLGDETSFSMAICCSWQDEERGWFSYKFLEWDMGDYVELVTHEEYQDRVEAICSHEGDEIAKVWEEGQDQVRVVRDDHPVFALRKRWEAMIELGLFFPSVNMKNWEGKPLSQEVCDRCDQIRQRQLEESVNWLPDDECAGGDAYMV